MGGPAWARSLCGNPRRTWSFPQSLSTTSVQMNDAIEKKNSIFEFYSYYSDTHWASRRGRFDRVFEGCFFSRGFLSPRAQKKRDRNGIFESDARSVDGCSVLRATTTARSRTARSREHLCASSYNRSSVTRAVFVVMCEHPCLRGSQKRRCPFEAEKSRRLCRDEEAPHLRVVLS